ncbi:hypothetical protein HOY80DRAFT_111343 [Tuber brumale]|nr:hypothetical protein HOY80DRAFT_111343 [Tuber brumale]
MNNNTSLSIQPAPGPVTPGHIKKSPDDGGDGFSTGQTANNFVIPEAIGHERAPHNTKGEPFIIGSIDVSASEDMVLESSDGYSIDRADLDTVDNDNSRLPPASMGPLIPISTISSPQVSDFSEFEDELEEGEVRGETITVFHNAARFNVKHPLMSKWTVWYTKPSCGKVHSYYSFLPSPPIPTLINSLSH